MTDGTEARDVVTHVLAGTRIRPQGLAIRAGWQGRRRLTHEDLRRRVTTLAVRFVAEGLAPGDAVLFSVRPGPDAVVVALAVVAAGGVVVVADPGAGPELFSARLALARPAWVAAQSLLYAASGPARWQRPARAFARRRGVLLPDYGSLVVRHLRAGPWLPGVPRGAAPLDAWARPGSQPAADLLPPDLLPAELPPADLDAPALVVFTSGTTAEPRGVVHTRRSLGAALAAAQKVFGLTPADRVVTDQLMIGLGALAAGASWTLPVIGAPPPDLARWIVKARATAAFTTPAGWDGVLTELAPPSGGAARLPDTLRLVLTGAAPVPAPMLARLAGASAPGTRVLGIYGCTELLPAVVVDAAEKVAFTGTGDLVGRPLPGVQVRIDPARREVFLSGPQGCAGYLRADGVEPLPEVATGDAGRLEPDGRLVLEGRLKDMLIRGSMNIYPGLYEPGVRAVAGVADCALVGLPHPITADERVVLALVPAPGEDAETVVARVRQVLPQVFDAAALPDDVVVLPDLPRAGRARKLDRAALVDRLGELLAGRLPGGTSA